MKKITILTLIICHSALFSIEIGLQPRFTIQYNTAFVNQAVFLPGSSQLATGDKNGVQLWDSKSGKLIRKLTPHQKKVMALVVSSSGKYLASYGFGGLVKVWDLDANKVVLKYKPDSFVHALAIAPDDQHLIATNETITVHAIQTGKIVSSFKPSSGIVTALDLTNDGKTLIMGISNNKTGIDIVDFASRKIKRRIETGMDVTCLKLAPDQKTIMAGLMTPESKEQSSAGQIFAYNLDDGKKTMEFSGIRGHVTSLDFYPGGDYLVSTQYSSKPSFYIWDIKKKKAHYKKTDLSRNTSQAGFSSDGKSLFVVNISFGNLGNPSLLDVYDIGTLAELKETGTLNTISTFKIGEHVKAHIDGKEYSGIINKTSKHHYLLKMDNRQPEYWKWVEPKDLRSK